VSARYGAAVALVGAMLAGSMAALLGALWAL